MLEAACFNLKEGSDMLIVCIGGKSSHGMKRAFMTGRSALHGLREIIVAPAMIPKGTVHYCIVYGNKI